jgi:hypothetical protein
VEIKVGQIWKERVAYGKGEGRELEVLEVHRIGGVPYHVTVMNLGTGRKSTMQTGRFGYDGIGGFMLSEGVTG